MNLLTALALAITVFIVVSALLGATHHTSKPNPLSQRQVDAWMLRQKEERDDDELLRRASLGDPDRAHTDVA